ncbi:MAG TPA: hypothetical protein PLJ78_15880, partial [Anaerolineae bacterium]|nr:hypothetical protein [Anaerolineae bacterium]HQK15413.1 hypothetical protein [Anaerolineae bacterium]
MANGKWQMANGKWQMANGESAKIAIVIVIRNRNRNLAVAFSSSLVWLATWRLLGNSRKSKVRSPKSRKSSQKSA